MCINASAGSDFGLGVKDGRTPSVYLERSGPKLGSLGCATPKGFIPLMYGSVGWIKERFCKLGVASTFLATSTR